MGIKILVVEDKKALNKNIVDILKFEGYEAFGALDFASVKDMFLEHSPDIIILDIMLPSGNGYELINFFRSKNDVRIIMLTALDDFETKKLCYEKGADDYITKPFEIDEIILKISAIKRRLLSEKCTYNLGNIIYDKKSSTLLCKKEVVLTPALVEFFDVLCMNYLQNPSNPNVYEVSKIDKRSVQTIVTRLRKDLYYIGANNIEIKTVYGKGYILVVNYEE